MQKNENYEKFKFPAEDISRDVFDKRVENVSSFLGWQTAAYRLVRSGIAFDKLNIIEIGCGTGTFCLAFALMGANVTLLDIDEDAIKTAIRVYSLYGLKPKALRASVTDPLPPELVGKFDMSVSIGLAEHFTGDDRVTVMKNHRLLLNNTGFAAIGIPNSISPFYVIVRLADTLTGQWTVKMELPFSPAELKSIGRKAGYTDISIIGNHSVKDDFSIYSKALLSSMSKVLPDRARTLLKNLLGAGANRQATQGAQDIAILREALMRRANSIKYDAIIPGKIKDLISSGLYLIGK